MNRSLFILSASSIAAALAMPLMATTVREDSFDGTPPRTRQRIGEFNHRNTRSPSQRIRANRRKGARRARARRLAA